MDRVLRRVAVRTLTNPPIASLVRRWNRDLGLVFMLHRLTDEELGIRGLEPDLLRETLAFLRHQGFRFVSLEELLAWARAGKAEPGPCIAVTLDDGYLEQARRALPIFAEFDVPATIFLTTGFVDREIWMWWDRLRHLVDHSPVRRTATVALGGRVGMRFEPGPGTSEERWRLFRAISIEMKRMSLERREARLAELARGLEVEIPEAPPARFTPMSWEDARRCEAAGVRLGPHTVTHPMLAHESEERARREIRESWSRLREELSDPVPVFCYPNGCHGDYGLREIRLVEGEAMQGALTAEPGYVVRRARKGAPRPAISPFELPRYSFPELRSGLVRVTSGLSPDGRFEIAGEARRSHWRSAPSLQEPGEPSRRGRAQRTTHPAPAPGAKLGRS